MAFPAFHCYKSPHLAIPMSRRLDVEASGAGQSVAFFTGIDQAFARTLGAVYHEMGAEFGNAEAGVGEAGIVFFHIDR